MEQKLAQLQAKIEADPSMAERLFGLETPEEVQNFLIEQGLEFSLEEINSLRETLVKVLEKGGSGELSDVADHPHELVGPWRRGRHDRVDLGLHLPHAREHPEHLGERAHLLQRRHLLEEVLEGEVVALGDLAGHPRGLLGVADISDEYLDRPQDTLFAGQVVRCRVLRCDPAAGTLGLSLRRNPGAPKTRRVVDAPPAVSAAAPLEAFVEH